MFTTYVIKLTLNSVCAAPSAKTTVIATIIHYLMSAHPYADMPIATDKVK